MDDKDILISVVTEQRNQVLNAYAQALVQIELLRQQLGELQAQVSGENGSAKK